MAERYEVVNSVLNNWHQLRTRYLAWPDQLIHSATAGTPLTNAGGVTEAEWERDWIDIGGEG